MEGRIEGGRESEQERIEVREREDGREVRRE